MGAQTELSNEARVLRVLHVDDDDEFLELAGMRLERERDDIVVEPVSDAEEALARLAVAEGTVECVVSDYDMPTMNGLEFLDAVRSLDPDLPFVLLTGRGSEALASRAIAAGVSDYVPKNGTEAPYARLANRIAPLVENYRNRQRSVADRQYLQSFHEITTRFAGSFDATIERLLAIGCERLSLDIGICSRIEKGTYEIRAVHVSDTVPDADLAAGDRFDLEATYCEQVVASDEPMGFADAKAAGFAAHPAYESFGLESYLGVPVVIDGRRYGTLNFSSPRQRDRSFTDEEQTLIGLMAEWIGTELGRRQAERSLERNRDLLSKTQRVANVGGWEFDLRTNEIRWTEETRRIHGVGPDYEPALDAAIDFYHPDDREEIADAVSRAIEHGERWDVELRIIRTDGEPRWVRAVGEPYSENGAVVMVRGAFQDITERVEGRERLEATARRLEALVENSPVAIMATDPAGDVTRWNPAAEGLFGWSAPEVLGEANPLVPKAKRDEHRTLRERALAGESVRGVELQRERKDGSAIDVRLSTAPIRGEDGTVTEIVAFLDDISARKRYERTLEDLLEATEDLFRADEGNEICEIAVETIAEVLDHRINAVWLYDDLEERLQLAASTADADERFETPETYRTDEDVSWQAFVSGAPQVHDAIDDPGVETSDTAIRSGITLPLDDYGVLAIGSSEADEFDDATEYLARILAANTEAALARAERVGALRERERWLRAQNERLDEFASIVSHDLRNPLTIAFGWLEVAEEDAPTEHHARIERALDRMNALVDDVLALARDGRVVRDPTPVSVGEIATAAWESVETHDASLVVDHALGAIDADGERLRRLFENLFRNAVEHGGQRVTVTVGAIDGGTKGIFVADDGPGIVPAERASVFEYGRSGTSTGTGFGLAIVESIAEAHGWMVTATESEEGGARFEFAFDEPVRSAQSIGSGWSA